MRLALAAALAEHRPKLIAAGTREVTHGVGAEGFEPPTPCASCRCSARLSHAPDGARQDSAPRTSPDGAYGCPDGTPRRASRGRHRRRIRHRRATCRRMAAEGAQVAVLDVNGDNADAVAKEIDGLAYTVDVTDFDALRGRDRRRRGAHAAGSRSSTTTRAAARCRRSTTTTSRSGAASSTSTSPGCSTASRPVRRSSSRPAAAPSCRPRRSRARARPPVKRRTPRPRPRSIALTASAALEYAPTIRVNAVSPGMIRTPLTELLLEKRGHRARGSAAGQDAARPDRHARRHRRRGRVPVLRPRPLRDRPEHRDRRRDDPARLRRRRRARHRPRSPVRPLTAALRSHHNCGAMLSP